MAALVAVGHMCHIPAEGSASSVELQELRCQDQPVPTEAIHLQNRVAMVLYWVGSSKDHPDHQDLG